MVTRAIASSSAGPEYLKGIRCLAISEKYSLASFDVLVPKPGDRQIENYMRKLQMTMYKCMF